MSNAFDFFNYNFSGLVSIFAALVGMAYPLIHQAIQRVDTMYESTSLAGYVQRQWPIQLFNIALIISIIFAITIPFLLRLFIGDEIVCLCFAVVHSIVTLVLLLSVVMLYHFLQITIRPSDMLEYIKKHPDGGKPAGALLYIAQIAKFASERNDTNLYFDASSHIAHVMVLMRRNNLKYESFPVEAREALLKLTQYFAEKPNGLMSHSTLLSSIFFDNDGYYPFSDGEFCYIWRTLDIVLQSGNESFISGYWTFADQYYRFVLRNYYSQHYNDGDVRQYHVRYKDLHTMLGSLLVYNKRFALLKTIMYFSNEEPPSYHLVPSSFEDIHESLVNFCKQAQFPFGLAHSYLMIGMTSDVNCDNDILATAYRYHAILTVRLFTINDYFVFSQSKIVPEVTESKIEDIEKDIQITNRLLAYIREYYATSILDECMTFVPKQTDVEGLVNQYIAKCNDKIKEIKNTHEIDYNKVSYIKENMIRAAENSLHIPDSADVTIEEANAVVLQPIIQWNLPINTEIVESGTYTNASNLPELIVERLNSLLWNAYNSIFLRTIPIVNYDIDFRDVKHAIDKLGIDDSYAVVSLGVYFGTFDTLYDKEGDPFEWDGDQMYYHNIRFFGVPSSSQSLIVLKKNDVPYHTIEANTDVEFDEVGTGLGLYSNIDNIQEINANQFELKTKRCISLHYKEYLRYVRISIKHYSDKRWDIESINKDVWAKNPYETIEKLNSMNNEELMSVVLACFPGHSDKSIKTGDIILPQHVAASCKITPIQAREVLNQLCDAGYLEYNEATERKVAGFHLAEKGFAFYMQHDK